MGNAIALDQPYFERTDRRENRLDEMLVRSRGWLDRQMTPLHQRDLRGFAVAAEKVAATIADLSDTALLEAATSLRARMLHRGLRREHLVRAFALAREACARQLGLRHFRVQLM